MLSYSASSETPTRMGICSVVFFQGVQAFAAAGLQIPMLLQVAGEPVESLGHGAPPGVHAGTQTVNADCWKKWQLFEVQSVLSVHGS